MNFKRDFALNLKDPALATNFLVRMPWSADNLKEIVAEKVTPTFFKTPATPRFNQGSNTYFPGITDIDGLTISFYETHDMAVLKWLNKWKLEVYDPITGVYGMPDVFKKTIYVEQYSQGSVSKVLNFEYTGCWPTDTAPFNLDYSDETGVIKVEAQFSVDSGAWS
jgi:hypothetical protein